MVGALVPFGCMGYKPGFICCCSVELCKTGCEAVLEIVCTDGVM